MRHIKFASVHFIDANNTSTDKIRRFRIFGKTSDDPIPQNLINEISRIDHFYSYCSPLAYIFDENELHRFVFKDCPKEIQSKTAEECRTHLMNHCWVAPIES